jgi:hypothetical protein
VFFPYVYAYDYASLIVPTLFANSRPCIFSYDYAALIVPTEPPITNLPAFCHQIYAYDYAALIVPTEPTAPMHTLIFVIKFSSDHALIASINIVGVDDDC